jgi:predicted enzyme related to lactoylglutathione lyase
VPCLVKPLSTDVEVAALTKRSSQLIKRVNWLEVKVTDMKRAIGFYRDVLGLRTENEWSNHVVFWLEQQLWQ